MYKAMFLTEREAREFISTEYGKSAEIRYSSINRCDGFDIDEMPFDWDGEASALEVNDGEALVGFWEALGNTYIVSFAGVSETTESLYEAREIAEKMTDVAEECNALGVVTIFGNGEEIEQREVCHDDDELILNFQAQWNRIRIGNTIRDARRRAGLSIRALASKAELSKNNVERIEGGRYNYTIDTLDAICAALGLSISIN